MYGREVSPWHRFFFPLIFTIFCDGCVLVVAVVFLVLLCFFTLGFGCFGFVFKSVVCEAVRSCLLSHFVVVVRTLLWFFFLPNGREFDNAVICQQSSRLSRGRLFCPPNEGGVPDSLDDC